MAPTDDETNPDETAFTELELEAEAEAPPAVVVDELVGEHAAAAEDLVEAERKRLAGPPHDKARRLGSASTKAAGDG